MQGIGSDLEPPPPVEVLAAPLDANYELANDIGAFGTTGGNNIDGAEGFVPIGSGLAPFNGTLDGNGFVISGLFIDSFGDGPTGLFASIGPAGTVHALGLEAMSVEGPGAVGGVGGRAPAHRHVYTTTGVESAIVGQEETGGLVGRNLGDIIQLSSSADVSQTNDAQFFGGGLAGYNDNEGSITQSYATGTVTSFFGISGGLVGVELGEIRSPTPRARRPPVSLRERRAVSSARTPTRPRPGSSPAPSRRPSGTPERPDRTHSDGGDGLEHRADLQDPLFFVPLAEAAGWSFTTTWAPPDPSDPPAPGHYPELYSISPVLRVT